MNLEVVTGVQGARGEQELKVQLQSSINKWPLRNKIDGSKFKHVPSIVHPFANILTTVRIRNQSKLSIMSIIESSLR